MSPEDKEGAEAQQRSAVSALAPLYVPACPGSGKTHVIVARHLAQPAGHFRQARALISFTRTARNQIGERCRAEGRAELAAFPNFIGTMDSFLWEFLVRPYLSADRQWQLVDTWTAIGVEVKLDRTVALAEFPFVVDPDDVREHVSQKRLSENNRGLISSSKYPWKTWVGAVWKERDRLVDQGYLSCHESRLYALRHLTTRASEVLGPLRSRFSEVMVDEVQDCSVVELAILGLLHDAGLKFTLVGDPDQMIYEWRDADRQRLDEFTAKFDNKIELTGNRRSTPTICALAATLRSGSRSPDISVAGHDDDLPVLLIPAVFKKKAVAECVGSGSDVLEVFCEQATTRADILPENCLITARNRETLPIMPSQRGANRITRLARAWELVNSGRGSAADIEQACRAAASTLLGYWYPDVSGSVEAIGRKQHLQVRDLLRQGYAFLAALTQPHAHWNNDVNTLIKSWSRPASAVPRATKGLFRGGPTSVVSTAAVDPRPRIDIVHQIKGDAADAVLLLLPDAGVGARWRDGDPAHDEELRILYVAVTRARRLLGLAVSEEELDVIRTLLTAARVPYHVIGPAESLMLSSGRNE
ncbi:UvrD-helicase domain-containing protein [Nonomuraea sp. M3C6]|uniref:UvrD-helicase domain-containing protein n=1 Tax=Nonomuraea marmarensis TaxID=3351344 RepID=A0ABW7ADM4_9ACTN